MDIDDVKKELGLAGARRLLRDGALLRLAYDGPDGHPRVIPIGFLWKNGRIVVCTSTSAPKVAALRERPRVAVTIDEGATPAEAKALLIRGDAALEVVDGIPDEYIEAAEKSLDDGALEEFRAGVTAMYPQMVRIEITPDWARFYDFGAGRLPATLQRIADAAAG